MEGYMREGQTAHPEFKYCRVIFNQCKRILLEMGKIISRWQILMHFSTGCFELPVHKIVCLNFL